MKLYTEEQVRKVLHPDLFHLILPQMQPIELPCDEEIEQEAYYKVSDHTENPYASFKSGAKWMRYKILNK